MEPYWWIFQAGAVLDKSSFLVQELNEATDCLDGLICRLDMELFASLALLEARPVRVYDPGLEDPVAFGLTKPRLLWDQPSVGRHWVEAHSPAD